jgi:hypothetical protein
MTVVKNRWEDRGMKHRKQAGRQCWLAEARTNAVKGSYQGTTLAEFAKHFDAHKH